MAEMAESPHKILVVDDEPDLERLVMMRMRREIRAGIYHMAFAHDGVEALEVLNESGPFDLVISDINMPRMDGLELLERIPVTPDIRAVVVSAYGDMRNIRIAMNRGAFDFLTKPVDFGDFRLTIDRTLRNLVEWRKTVETRKQLARLENELEVARRMQRSILPVNFPSGPGYKLHANMRSARAVGGDFYDFVVLEGGRVGFAVADVSGKGVPAALFMMSTRTLLKGAAIGTGDPGKALAHVNDLLTEDNAAAMFVTMLYMIFDPSNGTLTYATGGHDAPVLVHADGSADELPGTGGIALGVVSNSKYECRSETVSPGDTIVLYTDGVTEARNSAGVQFGLKRLCDAFVGSPPAGPKAATDGVFDVVSEFVGDAPQFDDITCVALQYTGGSA